MDALTEALLEGVDAEEIEKIDLPDSYTAAHLRIDDSSMFDGASERDVRKSLHVGRVPMPELAPDEVVVAVMASSINYNTVWSATFSPVPTFRFLQRMGREGGYAARHDLPHHVLGLGRVGRHRARRRRSAALARRRPCRGQLCAGGRSGAGHARRRHARRRTAHLGLRDQLRWSRALHRRPGEPAAGQAPSSDLGGVGGRHAHGRHVLPDADQRQRGPHQAGRHRPHLGGDRWSRSLRRAAGQECGRNTRRCGQFGRKGRHSACSRMRCRHQPERDRPEWR